MSVCSCSGIVSDSTSASTESNRQSSTRVACSENTAKFTPTPSHVAPSGYGEPGQTRKLFLVTEELHYQTPNSPTPNSQTYAQFSSAQARASKDAYHEALEARSRA